MIDGVALGFMAGLAFLLLALIVSVVVLAAHRREKERERQERQIDSVYNNRDRRKRGN